MRFLLLLVLIPSVVLAEEKSEDWQKTLSFGFDLARGNSDNTLFNFGGKLEREKGDEIWKFAVNSSYGKSDDEKTVDTSDLLAQYKKLISERLFYAIGLDALKDKVADVDYRLSLNPSIGYFLIKEDDLSLSLEVGPSIVKEEVGGIKEDYIAARFAEELSWKISETAKLFQALKVSINTEDTDDSLTEAEVGIQASISTHLSLSTTIKNRYDNQPAAGKKRNDVAVTTSLNVLF